MTKPLLLMILDGWGIRAESNGNAILQANLPNYQNLIKNFPFTQIEASGPAVGLPKGVMGNSEVGHLNMGAGRIAEVGLTRIYQAIQDGSFFQNTALLQAMEAAKQQQSQLHLLGLVSDGAVHSHQDHLYALLKMAKDQGLTKVFVHVFTDGRDTAPKSAFQYLRSLENKMKELGIGKIATISGRYYAMDRDQRWDRIELAYQAMVEGKGMWTEYAMAGVAATYDLGQSDEFIKPLVLCEGDGPRATIQDNDAVIFFNFRADRAREITRALTENNFTAFNRKIFPKLSAYVCMMEYDKNFTLPIAFLPAELPNIFPEIIAQAGLSQLRIAETEKYAHVTFFFNGGRETPFANEDRILIPSPKEVATYDLKPEMSAEKLTEALLARLQEKPYDVIVLNFANPDMVGHTGILPAAIHAVEVVDQCMGKICEAIWSCGGTVVITSDHGNCEQEFDEQGNPHTAHTTNKVPFILAGENFKQVQLRRQGGLGDIAPTLLQILGLAKPAEMTGQSLIINYHPEQLSCHSER